MMGILKKDDFQVALFTTLNEIAVENWSTMSLPTFPAILKPVWLATTAMTAS